MAQNDPPNVYPVRNACACERPNVVRDVNGWVACLKCGKLSPEQVGAETNIDNTYSVAHGQTSDEPQGQAEAGPESQEGSGGRQEVQPQRRVQWGEQEVSLGT